MEHKGKAIFSNGKNQPSRDLFEHEAYDAKTQKKKKKKKMLEKN